MRRSSSNPRWPDRIFIHYLLRKVEGEALWLGGIVKARSIEFFGAQESEWRRSLQQKERSWKDLSSESTGNRHDLCCSRHCQWISTALRSGGNLRLSSFFGAVTSGGMPQRDGIFVAPFGFIGNPTFFRLAALTFGSGQRDREKNDSRMNAIDLVSVPTAEPYRSTGLVPSSEGVEQEWKDGLCREPVQVDSPSGRLTAYSDGFSRQCSSFG